MRYARIHDGIVTNIENAEPSYAVGVPELKPAPEWLNIGDYYDPVTGYSKAPEPVLPPPSVVSLAQAKLALLEMGHYDQVQTALENMPEPGGQAARIQWEYRSEVHRDNSLVTAMAYILGLSDEDVDDLFRLADTL